MNAPEKKHYCLHGYRTTFKAAYRTAQLTYDLKFKGVSGFFSWPSAGKLVPYPTDGAAARSSALYLKTFISEIIQINELEQHIIA
ncbi:hypothetical protein CS542_08890 [Pedobacter sp. IW39]|nr:hypothetical protein CS542_08890 [Pedobacter sp. IW39]